MKLNASVFSFAAIAASLPSLTSTASAQPPLPAPTSQPSPAQSAEASPPTPTSSEADRGARGESCRARPDCQTGLACIASACRLPNEGKTCGARSDCGAPLACIDRTCVAEGERALVPVDGAVVASNSTQPALAPVLHPYDLSLDESFFTRSVEAQNGTTGFAYHSTSTILGFGIHAGHWGIEAEIPFAISVTSDQGKNGTSGAVGNGAIGIYYVFPSPKLRLEIGGIVGSPTEPDNDGDNGLDARLGALASRGYDRAWLWAPTTATLAPVFRIGSHEHDAFIHQGEVVIAPLFSPRTPELVLQLAEDLGAQLSILHAGAKAELVAYANEGGTVKQLSIMPHVGVHGAAGFVDLGFLINVTGPAGFSFDEGNFWGLRLRAGARF